MASNFEILNDYIELSTGQDFLENIPELTQANITEVGNAILDYEPAKNSFLNVLINKIGLTIISEMLASNKFSYLKGEKLEYGDTIEDIYVDYIKSQDFSGANENPFKQNKPNISVLYHTIDRQLQYKVTIRDVELRKAFKNSDGLNNLITKIINSLYNSKEYDEFTMFKQMLVDNYLNGTSVALEGETSSELARDLLYNIKKYSQDIEFNSREYNKLEMLTNTPLDNQILILHKDYKLNIDIDTLAGVFNLDKVDLKTRILTVDNFNADENKIVAVLLDNRGVRLHDSLFTLETLRNPEALATNYYLNVWQLISYAYFHNLIYFIEPTITPTPPEG